jgi:hypothetical protein
VITHPDGSQTIVVNRTGCGRGCSGAFWIFVGLFVIAYPAESGWPAVAIIGAYTLVALVAVAGVWRYLARDRGQRVR